MFKYLRKLRFKLNKYFIAVFLLCLLTGYAKEVSLLFLFVLIHELSHVFAAVLYGLKIESIEIYPFGGVARVNNIDLIEPSKEVVIYIAGPIFNILLAGLLFFLEKSNVHIPYFDYIENINLSLALVNLLPGAPLDGGRILRAVLSFYVGYRKAAKTAIISGKIIAVLLLLTGIGMLFYNKFNISLLVLAAFLYLSADKEENAIIFTVLKNVIDKEKYLNAVGVTEVMGICAKENLKAVEVLKYQDLKKYHIVIVLDSNMEIRQVLTETQVMKGLVEWGADISLGEICEKMF